jgi:Family of unknown function (DUF6461)
MSVRRPSLGPVRIDVAVVGALAEAVPVIVGRIPAGAAAELGRIGELDSVRPLLAERLLGALELTVMALELPDLPDYLGQPAAGRVAFAHAAGDSQVVTATALLERLRPGAAELAASLTRQLAGHELMVPLLAVPPDAAGEASIAAAHGAAHLALATAVASAVIGRWEPPPPVDSPAAAVVGVAIGAAVLSLRAAPMPAGYEAALLEKVRREYLMPRRSTRSVPVAGHRFALVEGEMPGTADFAANGLVAVVSDGAVIRTGTGEGSVTVRLTVDKQPPPLDPQGWDEVVEVSWHAAAGLATLTGADPAADTQRGGQTPPWPGDYRLRVHASGRDDADEEESYLLAVWSAPAAPQIVHKRTDRLGYRLRGEPDPDRPPAPEHAYRWMRHTALDVAATVTVVTGATVDEVLRAFGADPSRPMSLRGIEEDLTVRGSIDPWVAVLDAEGAVLAVEYNGFQGSDEAVLGLASARGRAASMFWNVNGLTCLSFAEGGRVLASFEPPHDVDAGPEVAAALDGLDFDDYRDESGKGLVAVERFTGRGITQQDLDRIEETDIAFWIVPR